MEETNIFTAWYSSPLGLLFLQASDKGLQKVEFVQETEQKENDQSPVLQQAIQWLDLYFQKKDPGFSVPLDLEGSAWCKEIWSLLAQVPYGSVVSYGTLARKYASLYGRSTYSARAVGAAMHKNPVSILLGCHRVVASSGSLHGYAWGLEKKRKLLEMEGILLEEKGANVYTVNDFYKL